MGAKNTVSAEGSILERFFMIDGIWAEFGKIVCISVGYFANKSDIRNFRVTSFFW
jgi:hypothetical protein